MSITIILIALFGLALISGRRFGFLGLGLAAGTLLAGQTTVWLEDVLMVFKQYLGDISPAQAAVMLLALAPSLVLMFTGPKYKSLKGRILGAIMYTAMAGFAILPFVLSSIDIPVEAKNFVVTAYTTAIAAGIVASVVDIFLTGRVRKN